MAETIMQTADIDAAKDAGARKGGLLRRMGRWTLVVVAVLFGAHVAWVNSGSNEWNVVSDKEGIRVSRLKSPGYTIMKYKVEMHLDSRVSDVVYYMSNLDTGYDVGATDIRRLEEVAVAPVFYVYDNYKLDLKPFGKLDVMVVNHYVQDPDTKKVRVDVYAAPNKAPVVPDALRVVHLSDSFTLTPLERGGVDLELVSEVDVGLPYVLQNLLMPGVVFDESKKMREMLKKDKYRNGRPAFIAEPYEAADRKPAQANG
jgi:hypothetical protein